MKLLKMWTIACGLAALSMPSAFAGSLTFNLTYLVPSVHIGNPSGLQFDIINNSGQTLTNLSFMDTLTPLVVAPGMAGNCAAGTIGASVGSNVISLSGASLPDGGLCSFIVNVTGYTTGAFTTTGLQLTSAEMVTATAADATLITHTPEPASASMLGLGFAGTCFAAAWNRRRRKATEPRD